MVYELRIIWKRTRTGWLPEGFYLCCSGEYKQHLAGETTLMKVQGMEGA